MLWDVFCQVVDNYGDAGFCWRLTQELAARGQRVRLWIDDPAPLQWLAGPRVHRDAAIEVLDWQYASNPHAMQVMHAPDVLIEAYGCAIPDAYLSALARLHAGGQRWPVWLNVEYLSAEPYVERMHGLPSPVMAGPAAGQCKTFIYPGFTPATGGLLRERNLAARIAAHDRMAWRRGLLDKADIPLAQAEQGLWVSLFCYEPACLPDWLQQWAAASTPVHLVAAAGRSQRWLRQCWLERFGGGDSTLHTLDTFQRGALTVHCQPFLEQPAFDHMLWSCDLNVVRGEESMVRALWAAVPLLWHIYPQEDHAHEAKLLAWLDRLEIQGAWRTANLTLNGLHDDGAAPELTQVRRWHSHATATARRLHRLPELIDTLMARTRS
ncbi:hypothetical protein AAV94_06680 [Lampropedia cohaerens]|uniref:Protein-arginine rhamnosyltransferase n=1 Tax=Lampropedia cohaerens TaxID=1610491 RepID=A0A0U1Q073_9BURK|nr:elongation factor P maturation arginine rhamnosyltransferase EarP [Lampropedia cohaerens]KKW68147.1 hypothetical protein AAV94_06680 [Lampropedia cohaerens]